MNQGRFDGGAVVGDGACELDEGRETARRAEDSQPSRRRRARQGRPRWKTWRSCSLSRYAR